ncbi:MAG: hypothetical protein R3A49_09980 [Acidimicrobiia bacterium]
MGTHRRVLLASLTALAVLLVACSDSGGDSETDDAEPPAQVTQPEFAALLETAQDATVRVTYVLEDGTSEPPVDENIVYAQDPPRVSVRTEQGLVIDNGDGSLASCTEGSDPVCVRLPGVGDAGQGLLSGFLGVFASLVFSESPSMLAGYTPEDGRVIAQRPAVCAAFATDPLDDGSDDGSSTGGQETASPDAGQVRLTECVDAESGVPLLLIAENEEGTAVRLVAEVVDTPTEDDFAAPTEVPDTPGS